MYVAKYGESLEKSRFIDLKTCMTYNLEDVAWAYIYTKELEDIHMLLTWKGLKVE